MNRKTRMKKGMVSIIALLLILQMVIPANYVSASVVSEELLLEADNGPEEVSDNNTTQENELISEEDTLSEPEALLEDSQDQLLSDDSLKAAEGPELDTVSEGTFEADNETAASTDIKDVTVMLYCVGSDLEGNSMAATCDICEIMEGIKMSGVQNPDVNFIIETGGVLVDKQGRARQDIIKDRMNSLASTYPKKTKEYTDRFKYLTQGNTPVNPEDEDVFEGISWNINERYEIYGDRLEEANNQPTNSNRFMTKANNNVLEELAEFIETTKKCYPAKRYMLILWDHGGGPKGGLGYDERDEDENTFQAWSIEQTMNKAKVSSANKFSYINYDACLMGNLETALAWAPYADYFCGSEDLEPGDGDFYENWVSMLYKAADDPNNNFNDDTYVNSLMVKLGEQNVEDFCKWYTEVDDNGTKSLIKLGEANALANALSNYAKKLSELFAVDPMEAYYGIYELRAYVQDFGGREAGIMDLNDFVSCMNDYFEKDIDKDAAKNPQLQKAIENFKKEGDIVKECEGKAVLKHSETEHYFDNALGGVTVYLPYLSTNEDVKKYFDGYKTVKSNKSLEAYRNFVGTFAAIQSAGKLIANDSTLQKDIDSKLNSEFKGYGIGGAYSGKLKNIPSEIMKHRIQNEGMKIFKRDGKYYYKRRDFKLVYDVYQAPLITVKVDKDSTTQMALGYMRSGPYTEEGDSWIQELINYDEQKWFAFEKEGKTIPVSIYYLNSGYEDEEKLRPNDPFTSNLEMHVPALYDGRLYMLDVEFKQGNEKGEVMGLWPFDYMTRTYGRYLNMEQFKQGEISILADLPNALEGEEGANFDASKPANHIIGDITLNKDTVIKRKVNLGKDANNIEGLGTADMRYFMKDLFGSLYFFDDIKETINVSVKSTAGSKRAGDTIRADEIGIKIIGQNGDEYTDSQFKDNTYNYYYVDQEGNKKQLVVENGVLGTEEPVGGYGPDGTGNDPSDMSPNKAATNFVPLTVDKDIKIFVEPDDMKIDNLEMIDGATVDLDKYFDLQTGPLEVTIKTADEPGGALQFANESQPGSKMAKACYISPVTYTGRKLLTTQSTGKGSKVIDLVLYSEDGKNILKEGTDYTVTYRYNKDVPAPGELKKIPCLVILGKGEYKGMKYLAFFTINKADMSDVSLSFDKKYAPLTAKGISLKATAKLSGGIVIPNNQLKYHYYDADGKEISLQELSEKYTTADEMIPLTVRAEALANAKNINTGSFTVQYPIADYIYAYPKNKGKLNVNLKDNKVSVNDGKDGEAFLIENLKKASIGRDELTYDDLTFHGVYYDRNFTRRVEGDKLTKAGTCYIAVSLNAKKQKEYGNYTVKALSINVKNGIKIKKSDILIDPSVYKVDIDRIAENPVPVTLAFDKNFDWDKLTLTCSTRDGGSVVRTIENTDMTNNKIVISDIDNSVPGNYTIQISSAGKNTGSLKLNYTVTK